MKSHEMKVKEKEIREQLKIKEDEIIIEKNKMQQEHDIKWKEYEIKNQQLKIKEDHLTIQKNKMQQEHELNENKIKSYEKISQQLKIKEQMLHAEEIKIEKKLLKLTYNTIEMPYITIIKNPYMTYISYIIRDALINMGWRCIFIDKSEINHYIELNEPYHYFLFLFLKEINKNVVNYKRYILYQLEQNINNELSINYKQFHERKILRQIYDNATLLIDYSIINMNVTKKYYLNEFKLMNVPAKSHGQSQQEHSDPQSNSYEYDIIFIGNINKRRENILNVLKKKYNVLLVQNIFNEELKKLCSKSRICLNIHYYDNAILERVRLNEMLDYGIKIISEKPCNEDDICKYYTSVHFIDIISNKDMNLSELIHAIEKIKYEQMNQCDKYNQTKTNDLKQLNQLFIEDIKIFKTICTLPKSVAIITANYGNYDSIKEVNVYNKDYFDWYLFTDKPLKNDTYNVIQYPLNFQYAHNNDYNRLNAKYIKCQALNIDILKKYEYIIWSDSSLQIKNKNLVKDIIELLKKKEELYFYQHYCRNNIKDEYEISKTLPKYKNHNMEEQIKKYINCDCQCQCQCDCQCDCESNFGLYECGIFIFKNNEKNIKIMNDWWEENVKYSYQDQLSLPYVLWKNNTKPFILNESDLKIKGSVWDNNLFGIIEQHK
jgi:hypothetical protein